MDNMTKFIELRTKYPNFYFDKYEVNEVDNTIQIKYYFRVPDLITFTPSLVFPMPINRSYDKESLNTLAFYLGLVELVSYWKATCSPNVYINAGKIDNFQIKWFKKLYFHGLGEFFYTNKIKTNMAKFMNIINDVDTKQIKFKALKDEPKDFLIPVGGGKDSLVTLELLNHIANNHALIVNSRFPSSEGAKISGIPKEQILEVKRNLDLQIVELNKQGFLNGHTPFSALLAFISYITAYLYGKKYIALSNESSANESNVTGTKINHQYSKSFEFEKDFYDFTRKYLDKQISYFSFLRPLNELQITSIFAKHPKYHQIFRSCNVGQKTDSWCCHCPKCLFVYIMLSHFLNEAELNNIFGHNLLDNPDLLDIFIGLIGQSTNKPFECVGTYDEINFVLVNKVHRGGKLPYLVQYYAEHYPLPNLKEDLLSVYNKKHLVPKEFEKLVKEAIKND